MQLYFCVAAGIDRCWTVGIPYADGTKHLKAVHVTLHLNFCVRVGIGRGFNYYMT